MEEGHDVARTRSAVVKIAQEIDESASHVGFLSTASSLRTSRDGWKQAGGAERRCQSDDVSYCEARETD